MTQQLSLFDRFRRIERPEVADLEAYLDQHRGWIPAKAISAHTGWDDRKIRDLASTSDQIGSGNDGYKLFRHMTREEYQHFRGRILNQVDQMRARIARADRAFFGPQHVATT